MSSENLLSEREKEILQLVAEGLTNREIAQKLSISHNTVKVHISNIFEKTGVSSRTEATLYAIQERIVDVPGGENAQPESKKTLWTYISNHPWISLASLLFVIVIVSTILVIIFNSLQNEEVEPRILNRWQELTPMPEARVGLAAVTYENQIYAIAGKGTEGISGSVFRYDIEGDSWERLLDKPTPVTDIGGVLIGEQIYIPGGLDAVGNPVDVLEIYDPRHDTWSTGTSMPEALSAYAIADFEGKMYLFGGWDGEKTVGTVLTYDPFDESWSYGTSMDVERCKASAVEAGGKIFVIGGQNVLGDVMRNESYSPQREKNSENPWNVEASIPKNVNIITAQGVGDLIFAVGENQRLERGIMNYSISNAEWNYLSVGADQFKKLSAITSSDGYLFFLGGENNNNEIVNNTLQFKAIYTILLPIVN